MSPDGRWLIFTEHIEDDRADIKLLSLDNPSEITAYTDSRNWEAMPRLSPDGKWLAYISDETGHPEIYVDSFPARSSRASVTKGGTVDDGSQINWSPKISDRRLLYVKREPSDNHRIMSVSFDIEGGQLKPRPPVQIMEVPDHIIHYGLEIHPGGERFLFRRSAVEKQVDHINIIQNFFTELNEKVPVP